MLLKAEQLSTDLQVPQAREQRCVQHAQNEPLLRHWETSRRPGRPNISMQTAGEQQRARLPRRRRLVKACAGRQAGRDALVSAPTGSGKTLAYLAPIVHDLQGLEPRVARGEGTHALVLVPTRELCLQVTDVLAMLLRRYPWLARALPEEVLLFAQATALASWAPAWLLSRFKPWRGRCNAMLSGD